MENCAGREHINCSGTRKAWGAGSLAHLQARARYLKETIGGEFRVYRASIRLL